MNASEAVLASATLSAGCAAPDARPATRRRFRRPAIRSVVCAVDQSANGRAARRDARLLARPRESIDCVSSMQLLNGGAAAIRAYCEGHDLLVLGASRAAFDVVAHATIPTLIVRSSPLGTDLTDSVLLPVDGSTECANAVNFVARLLADEGGAVTLMAAPRRDDAVHSAIDATSRAIRHASGVTPRLIGGHIPPESAIPLAAATGSASLVALGCSDSDEARRATAQIARLIGCSVLVLVSE